MLRLPALPCLALHCLGLSWSGLVCFALLHSDLACSGLLCSDLSWLGLALLVQSRESHAHRYHTDTTQTPHRHHTNTRTHARTGTLTYTHHEMGSHPQERWLASARQYQCLGVAICFGPANVGRGWSMIPIWFWQENARPEYGITGQQRNASGWKGLTPLHAG